MNSSIKSLLFFISAMLLHSSLLAAFKDSVITYPLPDSVKANAFITNAIIRRQPSTAVIHAGIQTDKVRLYISGVGKEKSIVFEYLPSAKLMATSLNVRQKKNKALLRYDWSINKSYRFLIATTSDSADNFSLYSGYVFLPEINKWKFICTCKITGDIAGIKLPSAFTFAKSTNADFSEAWVQRMVGSWKNLMDVAGKAPEINLMSHADSLQQMKLENEQIEKDICSGKTTAMDTMSGLFYTMLKTGTGNIVSLDDTVTVYYKGYLYATNEVFDQTKDKPAIFPLKRLVKGWQLGLHLCREGGKIKLVIPSALAYSIRTRSAKIPPNSILVFEIEILKTKKT